MPSPIDRALTIRGAVNSYATAPASGLTRVPVERAGSREDADRVLQVQIFALADAVADLARAVQELQGPTNIRRRPRIS